MDEAKVDMGYVRSADFAKKFDGLTGNQDADRQLLKCARAMLEHRKGTFCEDLYLVSVVDGKVKASATGSKSYLGVTPTKGVIEAIRDNPPNTLFAIHNHPSNIPPTGSDLTTSAARQYAGGVTALHNGDLFFYRHGHTPFTRDAFDAHVANKMRKGYNEHDAIIATLRDFEGRYGITWRKL